MNQDLFAIRMPSMEHLLQGMEHEVRGHGASIPLSDHEPGKGRGHR